MFLFTLCFLVTSLAQNNENVVDGEFNYTTSFSGGSFTSGNQSLLNPFKYNNTNCQVGPWTFLPATSSAVLNFSFTFIAPVYVKLFILIQ